ncbi:hypothetical protein KAU19_04595 [Candidatus Parcubacteria bacterium]|nr:hypothetical protein [Candidatus Parcubacteria bacterium]
MKAPNLTESDEISKLIKQINKIFKKRISYWKQFLKKNNLPDEYARDEIRKLVRHAKAMNDALRIETYALNDFIQLIELEVKWINYNYGISNDLIEDNPMLRLGEELLDKKNRASRIIKEIDLLLGDW